MKKKRWNSTRDSGWQKIFFMMRITVFFLFAELLQVSASVYSQQTNLNVKVENASISEVLKMIEGQSDFHFLYRSDYVKEIPEVTVDLIDAKLEDVLNQIIVPYGFTFEIDDRTVVIKKSAPVEVNAPAEQQKKSLSGTVVDGNGQAIPGVTVVVKGTTTGIITDADGKFKLAVPADAKVLLFSFVGMKAQEIVIGNKTTFNVSMAEETIGLEEVVAVGYATQKRATVTGSVATVRNEELVVTKNENVVNMLTGKMPGVRVSQKSSAPGAYDTTIDIRGMGTPLFVVDGVTRDQAYFARMDPQEIESISVLKDGSAAIYGLHAANGVMLITTKSGTSQNGKVDITYSADYSSQSFLYVPGGVNAQDYMTLRNEQYLQDFAGNYLTRRIPVFSQAQMDPYIKGTKQSSDWMGTVFNKTTPEQQHNLSINGGNDKLRYFMSLAYGKQDGAYSSGDYFADRWNFRSTVDAQITNRLKAKASIGAILTKVNQPNGTGWSTYKNTWLERPDAPIYANNNPLYLNGDAQILYDNGRNALADINSDIVGYNINKTRRVNGTLQLTYDIPGVKGLAARGMYDYTMSIPDNTTYKRAYNLYVYNPGTDTYAPASRNSPSSIQRDANFNYSTDMQLGLNYANKFGKHNISSFLYFEEAYTNNDQFSAYRELMINSQYLFAGEAANQLATGDNSGTNLVEFETKSLIGSLTYDYSGKYMCDFKFRYDGSSRFPKGSQWGFFPSISAGWRLSEESFMKDNLPMISNLKLRASYGEMGDDGSANNYPPTLGYNIAPGTGSGAVGWIYNGALNGGLTTQAIPNPNLTWYKIKMYNLALDFGILKNKLTGSFELYKRDRTGLLNTRLDLVPGTVGATLPKENLDSDRNFGWELSLDYRSQFRDFTYFIAPQISSTRSMYTFKTEGLATSQYDYWRNRTSGRWNNIWWGNESQHMFTSLDEIRNYARPMGQGALPGDWINNDWNGDGVVNPSGGISDDHPIATTGLPLFNYGINLGGSWKNFDLAANLQGSYGVYAQYGEVLTEALSFGGQNTLSYFMDRWRPADPNADYFSTATKWIPGFFPVTGHDGRRTGTNLVQNASFMRLKTLEIGYTLPKNLLAKVGVKSLRVYLSGYNLLTFTPLKNVDPERPGSGGGSAATYGGASSNYVDFYNYPVNKTYTLGASIKF
jgi:TonB-linked SusC/RagA family outer membrane protein